MSIRIAICGRIRSGKDTVAEMFIKDGYKEFKFSQGIREIIEKYFPESLIEGKPRLHYQSIGQDLRKLNRNVWINYTLKQIDEYISINKDSNIIISDMRQKNEAEILKERGYTIIKIMAPERIRIERMKNSGDIFDEASLNHETETQSDEIKADIIIYNDSTLDNLKSIVDKLRHQIAEVG